MKPEEFHPSTTATELLGKIGSGDADADFARAIHKSCDRVAETGKEATVILKVKVRPVNKEDPRGGLILSADVDTKLPKLPAAASLMQVGPKGELLTQLDFIMNGGPSEAKPQPLPDARSSNRMPAIGKVPGPAPLAPAPNPAPINGQKEVQP